MTTPATIDRDTEQRDALVGRLFQAAISTLDVSSIYVGDRLGLYRALADRGSATPGELAAATGTNERYVREWLEQQAATGILEVEDTAAEATARKFRVPLGHREVLLERDSLNWLTGLLRLVVGSPSRYRRCCRRSGPAAACRTPITGRTRSRASPR